MNGNRVPWIFSIVALVVALVACFVTLSAQVAAQDPAPAGPVVAVPVDGAPDVEPASVDPALVDPAAVDAAVSPAFTYQGVLRSGSAPANGSFDFQFALFNAVTGGTQRGSTQVAENVPVSQGRFATILNFGEVFGNEALWIALGVRGGTSTGAFTALNPRQSLTAVPFARRSATSNDAIALAARVTALEAVPARVTALETLLTGVTREDSGNTIRISNANLQVVSGSGASAGPVNGLGNIIVGYNEPRGIDPPRGGSHNIIVGGEHTYSSYGGVVLGFSNDSEAPYASVFGGESNRARGVGAIVLTGTSQEAGGYQSIVVGGYDNMAEGDYAVISGGTNNHANGEMSVVSGGANNTVSGDRSTIGGGTSDAELITPDKWGYGDSVPLD